jgi:hypothetical protein
MHKAKHELKIGFLTNEMQLVLFSWQLNLLESTLSFSRVLVSSGRHRNHMIKYSFIISLLTALLLNCNLPVEQDPSSLNEWPVTVYFTYNNNPPSTDCIEETFIDLEITGQNITRPIVKSANARDKYLMVNLPSGPAIFHATRKDVLDRITNACTTTVDIIKNLNTITLNFSEIAPPVIDSGPKNYSTIYSGYATFEVTARGYGLSYTWKKDATTYEQMSSSFGISVNRKDSGAVMRCIVCNESGCVESAPAILSVMCDTAPPKITILDTIVETFLHSMYVDNGVFAYDSLDRVLTNSIIRTGSANTSKAGQYPIHYSVSDSCGNSATASRIITVRPFTEIDTARPEIRFIGPDTIYGYSNAYRDSAFQAFDKDHLEITNKVTVSNKKQIYDGLYYLEYNVTDNYGNYTTRRRFFQNGSFFRPTNGAIIKIISVVP